MWPFRRRPIHHQMLTLACGCHREIKEHTDELIGQQQWCSRHREITTVEHRQCFSCEVEQSLGWCH